MDHIVESNIPMGKNLKLQDCVKNIACVDKEEEPRKFPIRTPQKLLQ